MLGWYIAIMNWLDHQVRNGATAEDIAEELGCSLKRVRHRVKMSKKGINNLKFDKDPKVIESEYKELGAEKLGQKYGVDPGGIRDFLILHGIRTIKPGKLQSKPYDVGRAIDMFESGKSLREISKVIGINEDKLSLDLRARGVDTKRFYYGDSVSISDTEIISLYQSGMSSREIEKLYKVSFSSVIRRLDWYGIDKRNVYDYIRKDVDVDTVKSMSKNHSVTEISELLGISRAVLDRVAKVNCIKFKNTNIGKAELLLYRWIKKNVYPEARQQVQTQSGIFPDIVCGNIAIEFNGGFWHSYNQTKTVDHVMDRVDRLYNDGFTPIIIWDFYDIHKVRDLLKSRFNVDQTTIYARKCEIREVDSKTCMKFLDQNHMQGRTGASVRLGLYHVDALVGVMTFKNRGSDEYELSRLCYNRGFKVIGGSQKLFQHFVKTHCPSAVLSYSDPSLFSGGVYESLNFQLIGRTSTPSYLYYNRGHILSRQQCQKHKLIKQGFDANQSEFEIMQSRGYVKINLCKQNIYKWTKG